MDLQVIQAFGAKTLVTLMESQELDEVGVPVDLLGAHAKEFGLEWHHLPIKDLDVPGDRFEDLWTYSGLRLRRALANGEKIVIHCLGGLGRTGTVAGRLLVEFGEEPLTAMKKIRMARRGCIETPAQEQYVENCRPLAFARVERPPEERVLACLLGGATGDAFGYVVEFASLRVIRERFGHGGIKTPVLAQGKLIVSDDTQMTLFTLEGLLRGMRDIGGNREPGFVASIAQAYMDWLETQDGGSRSHAKDAVGWLAQQEVMRERRAPGVTCLGALRSGRRGSIGEPINDSKGCGGVMRVAPVGLIDLGADATTVFQLAAEAAALTHGHPSGYLSAGMVAALVRLLVEGIDLTKRKSSLSESGAIGQTSQILRTFPRHEETLAAVNAAVALAAKDLNDHAAAVETLGKGWIAEEALAIALYAVLSARSFVEAISIAANHSGDSDSTASIAGQLWGAMNGLGGIPHDWVTNLDVLEPLLHLSRQLVDGLRNAPVISMERFLRSSGRDSEAPGRPTPREEGQESGYSNANCYMELPDAV
jgi:ADP-ribosylglycohydrolase/protein-tyrosine phosphatase